MIIIEIDSVFRLSYIQTINYTLQKFSRFGSQNIAIWIFTKYCKHVSSFLTHIFRTQILYFDLLLKKCITNTWFNFQLKCHLNSGSRISLHWRFLKKHKRSIENPRVSASYTKWKYWQRCLENYRWAKIRENSYLVVQLNLTLSKNSIVGSFAKIHPASQRDVFVGSGFCG